MEYLVLISTAYLIPVIAVAFGMIPVYTLAVFVSLPAAYPVVPLVLRESGSVLNKGLAQTARLTFLYCLFFSIGLLFS